ncbi:MAG: hypothetical protein HYT70_02700 [Candidatus Aenigmarchaeota archaeon]|nr:hypothetical protein [Candidatus Aenigmarchaeota archaeon]
MKELEERIYPPVLERGYWQSPAILVTNESARPMFFRQIQEREQIDGYIVGVGCGNCLTMLDTFSAGTLPEGIVMADISPHVVAFGRVVIEAFRRYRNFEGFARFLTYMAEKSGTGDGFGDYNPADVVKVQACFKDAYDYFKESEAFPLNDTIDVVAFVRDNYERFHMLANDGRMVMLFGNIYGKEFSAEIPTLPSFRGRRNIIYLSNSLPPRIPTSRFFDTIPENLRETSQRYNCLARLSALDGGQNVYVYAGRNIDSRTDTVGLFPLGYTTDIEDLRGI